MTFRGSSSDDGKERWPLERPTRWGSALLVIISIAVFFLFCAY